MSTQFPFCVPLPSRLIRRSLETESPDQLSLSVPCLIAASYYHWKTRDSVSPRMYEPLLHAVIDKNIKNKKKTSPQYNQQSCFLIEG